MSIIFVGFTVLLLLCVFIVPKILPLKICKDDYEAFWNWNSSRFNLFFNDFIFFFCFCRNVCLFKNVSLFLKILMGIFSLVAQLFNNILEHCNRSGEAHLRDSIHIWEPITSFHYIIFVIWIQTYAQQILDIFKNIYQIITWYWWNPKRCLFSVKN